MVRIPTGMFVALVAALVLALGVPTVKALSTRLGGLKTCADQTAPGSAGTPINLDCSGGLASTLIIENDSTTCIRVGGLENLSATTGFSVGDGCPAGMVVTVDSRDAYAISTAVGTVTGVDVVWGMQ